MTIADAVILMLPELSGCNLILSSRPNRVARSGEFSLFTAIGMRFVLMSFRIIWVH